MEGGREGGGREREREGEMEGEERVKLYNTSRMQALGERRRVLHRRSWLCIVPNH